MPKENEKVESEAQDNNSQDMSEGFHLKKEEVVKSKPKKAKDGKKRRSLLLWTGILLAFIVGGGAVYLVVDSKDSDTVPEGVSATDDPEVVELIKNASPGTPTTVIKDEIVVVEQELTGLTEGSREWVDQQIELMRLYIRVDDYDNALLANAAALDGATVLGDTALVDQINAQRQVIVEDKADAEAYLEDYGR